MSDSFHTGDAITISSETEIIRLGERLAKSLPERWVLALQGELGVGKTTFVKGLAGGLGCIDVASSPTYAIVHVYEGALPLVHCDWYRIERATELTAIGWDEMLDVQPRIVVEWADRFPERMPKNTRYLHFTFHDDARTVTLGAGW